MASEKRSHTTQRPAASAGRRSLRNRCLGLMLAAGGAEARAEAQFDTADNMTDRLAALTALVHHGAEGATAVTEAAELSRKYSVNFWKSAPSGTCTAWPIGSCWPRPAIP